MRRVNERYERSNSNKKYGILAGTEVLPRVNPTLERVKLTFLDDRVIHFCDSLHPAHC